MKAIIAIASAALLISAAGQATAQIELRPSTARVSYADLDLTHPSARALLESRVAVAIKHVCPERPAPALLSAAHAYDVCVETATADARQQLASAYGRRVTQIAGGVRVSLK
jgi:UrcA family protein